MKIPSRDLGGFAREVIGRCTAGREDRIARGVRHRNLYMTGDPDGIPQTYNRSGVLIEKLAAWLYSPVDLRIGTSWDGPCSPTNKAMGVAAVSDLQRRLRNASVDRKIVQAVKWSLIKGKSFLVLRWTDAGFEADVLQPEVMGVERNDLTSLDEQQAFVHSCWYTIDSFVNLVWNSPDKDLLINKAISLAKTSGTRDDSRLKTVIVGGGWNGVYQAAGSGNPNNNKGTAPDWLSPPSPYLSPELSSRMLQVDTLWVRDDERGGRWVTMKALADGSGNSLISGKYQIRNDFADSMDEAYKAKRPVDDPGNPLRGLHNIIEFCPNEMADYFWGYSEYDRCAMLQRYINQRMDGINSILRRQENPPRAFLGMTGATQNNITRLNKPGGWYADPSPNGTIKDMQPEMPANLFQSLHEHEAMMDEIFGITPTIGGQGDSGVRSQNHAESLLRAATPHIKNRAIEVERSVAEVANLGLLVLKAHIPDTYTGWVRKSEAGLESEVAVHDSVEEPPVKDMVPVQFHLFNLPPEMRATVDGHSSSPVFLHEHEQLMFQLSRAGALSPEMLVRTIHPPHEDQIVDEIERRAVQQSELIQQHPEILTHKKPKV